MDMRKNESTCNISRRGFFQGSGIALGGLALAGGLSACASSPTADSDASKATSQEEAVTEEGDAENIAPVDAPESWDKECDVLVVGAGGAGLLAALKAAKEGASVVLIEKSPTTGGAARFSTAAGAYGTYAQGKKAGFDLSDKATHDEFYNLLWERQNYTIEGSLMESIMMNSGEALNWIQDNTDIEWDIREEDPYNIEFRYHTPVGKMELRHVGVMGFVTDELYEKGQEAGVECMLETEAKALVRDGEGIVGVMASQGGNTLYIRATATILSAGGMANNRAMLQKYVPTALEACGSCYDMYGTGDAIRMGWGAGADIAGFDSFDAFDGGITYYENDLGPWYHFLYNGDICLARQPWLFVNSQSNRFAKIEAGQLFYRPRIIGAQPDYKAYAIFDDSYQDTIWTFGERGCRQPVTPDDPGIDFCANVADSLDWTETVQKAIDAGAIKKADSIEELAGQLGLDPEKLASTVERYNGYCEDGVDPEFGTDKQFLAPISKPPYYGIEVKGLLASTDCGLRVNRDFQALDTSGNPIPGLFAAGHTAGGGSGEFTFAHATFTSNMGYIYASGYGAAKGALSVI